MKNELRGGNSRLLAKSLDQLELPAAILDRRGTIIYVNSALCELADADATKLVGKQCSWQVAGDETPFAAILTALAPPAGALQGKLSTRQLSAPIVFGSTANGELFLPIRDADNLVHMTIVMLGDLSTFQRQLPTESANSVHTRRREDRALVAVRSTWKTLDGLLPLIGESPAIELAMSRAQLAIAADCNFLVSGAANVGRTDVAQAIFLGRLKRIGLGRIGGQLFPIECAVLDSELFAGMLDVFAGRIRADSHALSQQLLLQRVDNLSSSAIAHLLVWLEANSGGFTLCATSSATGEQLAARGPQWSRLASKLAATEIHIPALERRREDIAPLAQHAMASYCKLTERAQLTFAADAIDLLTAFPWPENLTQLTQAVEDSVNHAVLSAAIHANHLPVAIRAFPSSVVQAEAAPNEPIDLDAVLLDLEKILLQRALKLSPRNRAQAARLLGISRPRLLRRIAQLGLDDDRSAESET